MRIKSIFICALYVLPIFIKAQTFNFEWQACYGGSETDLSYDILPVSGGYFIVGWTASSDGNISTNNGLSDGWVVKINTEGGIVWEKNYGGTKGDNIYRIFPAGQEEYYLIGTSNSSDGDISFDPYPTTWDLWLLKINSQGNIIWEEIYGGNGDETVWTGTTTDDGGLVSLVWTGSNDGDVSNHYGLYDAWMIKVNSDGEKQWDFTLGSPGQDVGQAIIQTSDDGFLVGISSILFEGGNITCTPHNTDYSEAVLVKLDSDLNIEWDRCYGGSDSEGITTIVEKSDGYVFGGYTYSNDGDVTGNHGKHDIWIVKVDYDGSIIWQKCLGGSESEFMDKISINEDAGYIISGYTKSNNGDVSNNHSNNEYDADIWIVSLAANGEIIWEHCFGGNLNEEIHFGFHYKGENNFVIAGQTDYGPSFDVGCTPYGGNGIDRDFWVFEVKDTTVHVQEQSEQTTTLSTYPNPARNYVCFERKDNQTNRHLLVSIFSVSGIPVKELVFYPGESLKVWDSRKVTAGVYFFRCQGLDGKSAYGKIAIEAH